MRCEWWSRRAVRCLERKQRGSSYVRLAGPRPATACDFSPNRPGTSLPRLRGLSSATGLVGKYPTPSVSSKGAARAEDDIKILLLLVCGINPNGAITAYADEI